MKSYRFLFTITFALFAFSSEAQITVEEYIEACPEMEFGKVYTGIDVRAVKKRYDKGTHVFKHSLTEQFPFAKITNGNYVTVLVFDNEFDGKLIHMHAYIYDRKNYEKIYTSSYIYSDGKNFSGTVYKGTIELSKKGKIIINQSEDDKFKTHTYTVGKKKFEYGE